MWFKDLLYRVLWFVFFECLPVILEQAGKAPKINFRGSRSSIRPSNKRDFR